MLEGGCYCGAIRYRAGRPARDETACHCTICRRTAGAPFVAWCTVERARFRFVKGRPARFRSSARATRTFCPGCGTQLTFEHDDLPQEIDLTIASLDDPDAVPPRDHTWTSRRLEWLKLADGLPEHSEARRSPRPGKA